MQPTKIVFSSSFFTTHNKKNNKEFCIYINCIRKSNKERTSELRKNEVKNRTRKESVVRKEPVVANQKQSEKRK